MSRDKVSAAGDEPEKKDERRSKDELLRRVQPQSLDGERAVLGALLMDNKAIEKVKAEVAATDFYKQGHATIYQAVLDLHADGKPADLVTVAARLRDLKLLDAAGGLAELSELMSAVPTSANAVFYGRLVAECSRKREALQRLAGAQHQLFDGVVDPAELERAKGSIDELIAGKKRRREPVIIQLSKVEPLDVEFLWKPYLPIGKLTLLDGDPSSGKTWVALAIAASITRGCPIKVDGMDQPLRDPSNVLYLSNEDGLEDTIHPRFERLMGDLERFYALRGVKEPNGKERSVTISDREVLSEACKVRRPALIVVDPIQSFLGDVDMNKAAEVRPLLDGLGRIAQQFHAAILIVRHLNKGGGGKGLYRGLGTIDFQAAARSSLLAGCDPRTEKRAILHVKSSLAPKGRAIGYELGEHGLTWTGNTDLTEKDLLSSPDDLKRGVDGALDQAQQILRELLANGPESVSKISEHAKRARISWPTMTRARSSLGIRTFKKGAAGNLRGGWYWHLPDSESGESSTPGDAEGHLD